MTATLTQPSQKTDVLYLALDLSWNQWRLAFVTALGDNPRIRSVAERNTDSLLEEIRRAKSKLGLAADCAVRCVYEAGRDGFWLHRFLHAHGIANEVVDSSSIEVNRKKRRAKTDRIDAAKLVQMLVRHHAGERGLWSVVHVPGEVEENRRQLHRELAQLKRERTSHVNRIRGLLASCGLSIVRVDGQFLETVQDLRLWHGGPLAAELQARLRREFARWQQVQEQIEEVEADRVQRVREMDDPAIEQVRTLLSLKAIGINSAWMMVMEIFSWRQIRNRRELASLVGLCPTPFASGSSCQEQGISKAGHAAVRAMLIEIGWGWLRWQPASVLSQWFLERFGAGGKRHRRVGIVALARKVLVAMWRYVEYNEIPAGAVVVPWQDKLRGAPRKSPT